MLKNIWPFSLFFKDDSDQYYTPEDKVLVQRRRERQAQKQKQQLKQHDGKEYFYLRTTRELDTDGLDMFRAKQLLVEPNARADYYEPTIPARELYGNVSILALPPKYRGDPDRAALVTRSQLSDAFTFDTLQSCVLYGPTCRIEITNQPMIYIRIESIKSALSPDGKGHISAAFGVALTEKDGRLISQMLPYDTYPLPLTLPFTAANPLYIQQVQNPIFVDFTGMPGTARMPEIQLVYKRVYFNGGSMPAMENNSSNLMAYSIEWPFDRTLIVARREIVVLNNK